MGIFVCCQFPPLGGYRYSRRSQRAKGILSISSMLRMRSHSVYSEHSLGFYFVFPDSYFSVTGICDKCCTIDLYLGRCSRVCAGTSYLHKVRSVFTHHPPVSTTCSSGWEGANALVPVYVETELRGDLYIKLEPL